ncbi:protein dead ringer isoform X2 [Anopheles ziemanni]|uniref:protein dead ringer isoform X2 n=1 Tax=Anopheles coustani TaxID=139045 RepID=UPI002657C608|nr:protein dead ringer isoform X2 [Anopheles coustani]XP_058168668.1 protein dead ringer isoform X2 [Anopheles ziemanni]
MAGSGNCRAERDTDSDLGDDSPLSNIADEHSDHETDPGRDGESSDEGVNVNRPPSDAKMTSGMEFGRSPDHHSELSQATAAAAAAAAAAQFGANHPLGVLGNLTALNMNVPGLSGLASGLAAGHHAGDVLEKLKMQVRDMKVGALMGEQMAADFAALHAASSPFGQALAANMNGSGAGLGLFSSGREDTRTGSGGGSSGGSMTNREPTGGGGGNSQTQSGSQNGGNFSFTLPNAPISKDGNPGSNSSTSSETSNSSQQNNGWSFEEQFKQVRQLYEINDDPKRKEFLDDLFLFMQKRGTPINRLPIMAKSVLDLYELYNLVIARGGLVDVINKKLWQEIIKGLHLPSSITSAAFTLRTQYMKYLYPYECEKKNLSTPAELQAAIDGNRREGRRSSYGQFDPPSVQRSPIPQGMSQMPPLSLVSHVNQQQHHHRLLPPVGQIPNMLPAEFEQRMLNYIKMFQPKEMSRAASPDKLSALNALELSRVALWNMYNPSPNSPPNSLNTSPENNMQSALDLSESPDHAMASIKRERDHPVDFSDPRDYGTGLPPPAKRSHHNHHHSHSHHSRSLTPQKLNSSSHDEDDARSGSTPINLRENGAHGRHRPSTLDDDGDDEEDDTMDDTADHEDDMIRASIAAAAAAAAAVNQHPLALSLADHHLQQQQQQQHHQQQQRERERERVQQQVVAAAREQQQQQQQQREQHMATLDLSILDRERQRCDSADNNKLKRQSQQHQQGQQHGQQLLEQHHHQRQLQARVARELRKHENGDHRLSLTPDSDLHHSKNTSGGLGDPFSSPLGITGMQFKLISRGDASKGDQKLVVTMEFNGVQYEGVLFANPLSSTAVSAPASTPPSSSVSATSASPVGSMVSPVKAGPIISPLDERDSASNVDVQLNSLSSVAALTTSSNGSINSNGSNINNTTNSISSCVQQLQLQQDGVLPSVPTTVPTSAPSPTRPLVS